MSNKKNLFLSILIITLIALIISSPVRFVDAAANGIEIWWKSILPAVLPFMLFSKILTNLGVLEKIGTSRYTFLVSIMSGYPVGAKMCGDLYEGGKVSRQKAMHMLSYCSNSGPMFMLGTVGIGMLMSAAAGYIIFISHIIGALLNGLFYRSQMKNEKLKIKSVGYILNNNHTCLSKAEPLNAILINSVLGILSVGAVVMLFAVVIEAATPALAFLPGWLSAPLVGMLEMTYGAGSIAKAFTLPAATVLSSFIVSFGGLSTMMQSMALISKIKMPPAKFFLFKLTHGIFAAIVSLLFILVLSGLIF